MHAFALRLHRTLHQPKTNNKQVKVQYNLQKWPSPNKIRGFKTALVLIPQKLYHACSSSSPDSLSKFSSFKLGVKDFNPLWEIITY